VEKDGDSMDDEVTVEQWAETLKQIADEFESALSGRFCPRFVLFEWHMRMQDLDFAEKDEDKLLSFPPLVGYKPYAFGSRCSIYPEPDGFRMKWAHHDERDWKYCLYLPDVDHPQLLHDIFSDLLQKACALLDIIGGIKPFGSERLDTAPERLKLFAAVLDGLLPVPYDLAVDTSGGFQWIHHRMIERSATIIGEGSPIVAAAWLSEDFVRHAVSTLRHLAFDLTRAGSKGTRDRSQTIRSKIGEVIITSILPEFQTRTMTKSEAGAKHGDQPSNPRQYIGRLIEKGPDGGGICKPMGSGQQWVFDIRDFPEAVQESISPKTNDKE